MPPVDSGVGVGETKHIRRLTPEEKAAIRAMPECREAYKLMLQKRPDYPYAHPTTFEEIYPAGEADLLAEGAYRRGFAHGLGLALTLIEGMEQSDSITLAAIKRAAEVANSFRNDKKQHKFFVADVAVEVFDSDGYVVGTTKA